MRYMKNMTLDTQILGEQELLFKVVQLYFVFINKRSMEEMNIVLMYS